MRIIEKEKSLKTCYFEWKLIVSLYVTYRKVGGVFYIVEFGNHNQKFKPRHANLSNCHHL